MSKTVVVLGQGGTSELLTVEDSETSITWPSQGGEERLTISTMPIEMYFCEGEIFYFARMDSRTQ